MSCCSPEFAAGKRKLKVGFYSVAETEDDAYGQERTGTLRLEAWVSMKQTSRGEYFERGRLMNKTTWTVSGVFADLSAVQVSDYMQLGAVEYSILGVENVDMGNQFVRVYVVEGQAR